MKKKLLSLALSISVILSLFSFSVFAELGNEITVYVSLSKNGESLLKKAAVLCILKG